ncbi:MAG: hypothetical protein L0Z50_02150 [Verrucomicrobiales bacterium]|nr:hypothetical protein [Verrucomicrobiales bacterium]
MNGADHNEFWQAHLSPEEKARRQLPLGEPQDTVVQFEEDMSLNRLLQQLPGAPVSSNFTSQVMQLVRREHQRCSRPVVLRLWADYIAFSWGRKLAFASVLALVGLLSYQQYQLSARRELAQSVLRVSNVLPTAEFIEGFSAIDGLTQVPVVRSEEPDLLDALR